MTQKTEFRDSIDYKYQNFMVLFYSAAIVVGILAIKTAHSVKFMPGIVWGYVGVGISVFIFLAMLFLFALHVPHRKYYRLFVMQNLSSATQYYCEQNKGHLPNAQTWCDQLLKSFEKVEDYSLGTLAGKGDSYDGEKISDFAFNINLDGYKISEIERKTVLLFTAELGWNQNGTSDLLPPTGYPGLWPFVKSGYYFIFIGPDSTFTVEFIKDSKVDSLNWTPSK